MKGMGVIGWVGYIEKREKEKEKKTSEGLDRSVGFRYLDRERDGESVCVLSGERWRDGERQFGNKQFVFLTPHKVR